jgi:hypothetical protein
MTQSISVPTRDLKIDVLKGLLTIGMVWGHMTGGYTGVSNNQFVEVVRVVFMMTIFSGFVFCMGYIMQTTYFDKEMPPVSKMLRSAFRSLAGYYISALAYFLIFKGDFNWQVVKSALLLRQLGSISEFLLPFALIPLVTVVLTVPLKKYILPSDRNIFLAIFALLMVSFIPYDRIQSPYLAIFLGSSQGVYYPVVQFYALFLLGAYYASRKIEVGARHLVVAALALAVVVSTTMLGEPFSRFPPSFGWIVCSAAIFFLWFWIAEKITLWRPVTSILAPMGANSLFILVASNIIIFGLSKGMSGALSTLGATLLTGVILVVVFQLMNFVRPAKV